MGEKLLQVYTAILKKEGLTGQMRLAFHTDIPESGADTLPDTEELFAKFASAYEVITRTPYPHKFSEPG